MSNVRRQKESMRLIAKRLLFISLLAAPVATWAFFKPIRVLAPELAGVTCTPAGLCVDDLARLDEAIHLKDEAVQFVQSKVGSFKYVPRAIFCSSAKCAKSFGFTDNGAYNVGTSGLVIGPRGWHPYFVRHELIHHVQNERIGSVTAWLLRPKWFIEGMAYSLSEDPRHPLPSPLEEWRAQYEQWSSLVGFSNVWQQSETL